MNLDTIQQLIRILAYAVGGYFLGDGVVEGEQFQSAIGGVLHISTFIWWFFWQRNRDDA